MASQGLRGPVALLGAFSTSSSMAWAGQDGKGDTAFEESMWPVPLPLEGSVGSAGGFREPQDRQPLPALSLTPTHP